MYDQFRAFHWMLIWLDGSVGAQREIRPVPYQIVLNRKYRRGDRIGRFLNSCLIYRVVDRNLESDLLLTMCPAMCCLRPDWLMEIWCFLTSDWLIDERVGGAFVSAMCFQHMYILSLAQVKSGLSDSLLKDQSDCLLPNDFALSDSSSHDSSIFFQSSLAILFRLLIGPFAFSLTHRECDWSYL